MCHFFSFCCFSYGLLSFNWNKFYVSPFRMSQQHAFFHRGLCRTINRVSPMLFLVIVFLAIFLLFYFFFQRFECIFERLVFPSFHVFKLWRPETQPNVRSEFLYCTIICPCFLVEYLLRRIYSKLQGEAWVCYIVVWAEILGFSLLSFEVLLLLGLRHTVFFFFLLSNILTEAERLFPCTVKLHFCMVKLHFFVRN